MKRYFLLLMVVGLFLFNPIRDYFLNKPDINFVNDDKLMWLLDVNYEEYRMETKEEYSTFYSKYLQKNQKYECGMEIDGNIITSSYECYLEKVNNDPAYKYNDWRLATKEELLRLEIRRPYFMRWFVSEKTANKSRAIDTNLFYDGIINSFSSDIVKPDDYGYDPDPRYKQFYAVTYGRRYPTKLTWSKRQRSFVNRPAGASSWMASGTLPIRLVRDREPSKYWVDRVIKGIFLIFIGFLLYKTPKMWRAVKQWYRDTFLPTPVEKLEEQKREEKE